MVGEYYRAARTKSAIVEKDWLGALVLTGADRVSWLQGMVTNEVQKLASGEGCSAAHLNAQGKLVAPMTVLVDESAVWLAVERTCIGVLAATFDRLIIMEDVQVQNVSDEYAVFGLIGPDSIAVLESWLGEPFRLDRLDDHRQLQGLRIVRSELGYDVWVSRELADKALRALAGSGAVAIDRGTWDVLRTEAGLPVYGVDIDDTTVLPELGDKAISYDKGCYIGQEVVAKIKYIGHVNRKFTGFICDSDAPPEMASKVRHNGKDVGYITTALMSPALGKPIALGFTNRTAAAPGTVVELVGTERRLPATVTSLPFVT